MTVPSNFVQIQGQGSVSADQLNSMVQLCTTAVVLRSFPGAPNMTIYLLGTNSVGDGGAGIFYWNSSSIAPDDGTSVIVPTGVSQGAWLRIPPLVSFPPLSIAPANPAPGTAYLDTTLGYPRIYGTDNQWHGFLLS